MKEKMAESDQGYRLNPSSNLKPLPLTLQYSTKGIDVMS